MLNKILEFVIIVEEILHDAVLWRNGKNTVINGTQNVGPREPRVKNCNSAVPAREREKRDR